MQQEAQNSLIIVSLLNTLGWADEPVINIPTISDREAEWEDTRFYTEKVINSIINQWDNISSLILISKTSPVNVFLQLGINE